MLASLLLIPISQPRALLLLFGVLAGSIQTIASKSIPVRRVMCPCFFLRPMCLSAGRFCVLALIACGVSVFADWIAK